MEHIFKAPVKSWKLQKSQEENSTSTKISNFFEDHQEELNFSTGGLTNSKDFDPENYGKMNGIINDGKGIKRQMMLQNQENKFYWENYHKEITDASKKKIRKISNLAQSEPNQAKNQFQDLQIQRKYYTLEIRRKAEFEFTNESLFQRLDCDFRNNTILVNNRKNLFMIEYFLQKGDHNCQTLFPDPQNDQEISCVKFLTKLDCAKLSNVGDNSDFSQNQFGFGCHGQSNLKIADLEKRNVVKTFDYSHHTTNATTKFCDSNESLIILVDDTEKMRFFDIRQKDQISSNDIFDFSNKTTNNHAMDCEINGDFKKVSIVNQIELLNNTAYLSSTIGPLVFDIRHPFKPILPNLNEEPILNIGGFLDEYAENIFTCFYDDNFIDIQSVSSCKTITTILIPRKVKDVCYCKSTNEIFVLCSGNYNEEITPKYKKHKKMLNCDKNVEQILIFKKHTYNGHIKFILDDFIQLQGDFKCFRISINSNGENLVIFGNGICSIFERDQKNIKTKLWKKVLKSQN